MTQLSGKQHRFVAEYLVDCNGTAAAVRAGYGRAGARVAGHRLLRNANVVAELRTRQDADAALLQIAREDALQGIREAIDVAREQCNPMAQIAGWREIGKMLGFYAPELRRVELGAESREHLRQLEGMSDAELLEISGASGGPM